MKNKLAAALMGATVLSAAPASAAVIVDPFNEGATRVFPGGLASNPDLGGQDLFIGYSAGAGALDINADAAPNGVTSVTGVEDLFLALDAASPGRLRIIGNGAPDSASLDVSALAVIGRGGDADLEIREGGRLFAHGVSLTQSNLNGETGASTTVIDGAGSLLSAADAVTLLSADGAADMTVSNGGTLRVVGVEAFDRGAIFVGASTEGGSATLTIEGAGSTAEFSDSLDLGREASEGELTIAAGGRLVQTAAAQDGGVFIGSKTGSASALVSGFDENLVSSSIDVENDIAVGYATSIAGFTQGGEARLVLGDANEEGEQVTSVNGEPLFDRDGNPILGTPLLDENGDVVDFGFGPIIVPDRRVNVKAAGSLIVENSATVTTRGDILISANSSDPNAASLTGQQSVLTVRDNGSVTAQTVVINEGGLLNGDGGVINADVVVDGGTLAPGASPGRIDIFGDLVFDDIMSVLEIEVAGTDFGDFDVVNVSGDLVATEGFRLELSFLDDFLPELGDSFEFLNVSGQSNLDLALIDVIIDGVPDGFGFDFNFAGGVFSFQTASIDVSEVPVPGALPLMLSGLAAFAWLRRRRALPAA